jgi:hypothetical protein
MLNNSRVQVNETAIGQVAGKINFTITTDVSIQANGISRGVVHQT